MLDRLKLMEARYNEINDLLIQPEIVCDIKKLTTFSKERCSLDNSVNFLISEQIAGSDNSAFISSYLIA